MHVSIKKGLDIPLKGRPVQVITDADNVSTVAVLGSDFNGLKPGITVQVGERVKLGQVLFTDKRNPLVQFTSPGAGEVIAINRGIRRVLQSIVIRLEGDDEEKFGACEPQQLPNLNPETVRDKLLASGLWSALRTRPFSRIPLPETRPGAIFVTAIDTNPLAPNPAVIIADAADAFACGLQLPRVSRAPKTSKYVTPSLRGHTLPDWPAPISTSCIRSMHGKSSGTLVTRM
jgi:Na+-transporting NADH:ubiquinone oxidoreductase subunit A